MKYQVEWVAWPSAYDWPFLIYYYEMYAPDDKVDLPFKATCISSMAKMWSLLGGKELILPTLTHVAEEDAKIQGSYFLSLLQYAKNYQLEYKRRTPSHPLLESQTTS